MANKAESKSLIARSFSTMKKRIDAVEPDKWRHFYAGIIMGFVLQMAALLVLDFSVTFIILIVLIIVVAISYGFELISLITGRGHYDIVDAAASIIGGVTGMAPAIIIYYFM